MDGIMSGQNTLSKGASERAHGREERIVMWLNSYLSPVLRNSHTEDRIGHGNRHCYVPPIAVVLVAQRRETCEPSAAVGFGKEVYNDVCKCVCSWYMTQDQKRLFTTKCPTNGKWRKAEDGSGSHMSFLFDSNIMCWCVCSASCTSTDGLVASVEMAMIGASSL